MADKDNNRRHVNHKPSTMLSRTHFAAWAGPVGGLSGLILAAASQPALAACSASGTLTPGTTVTCDSTSTQSSRVGQGPGADNVTVNVNGGAQIQVTNDNSISLGNNANITVSSGAVVQTTTTTQGGGQYGDGTNTIDVNNNSKVTIQAGGSVIATGVNTSSEAINPYGSGNTITNYGLIQGGSSTALWFQNVNTNNSSPVNTVDNFGTIQVIRPGATTYDPTANVVGESAAVGINFINETGGKVYGNLVLSAGNDTVTLDPGSVITGSMDGGGGTNVLNLNASATSSDSIPGAITNFQTLDKTGAGTWTLTGAVGNNGGAAPLAVAVVGGTLVLTGNNSNFNGSVTIDSGATLEARAQSLPPVINDLHGDLLINQVSPDGIQPNDGTYAGVINGSGIVTKIGVGTVTLTGVNTYSGGTFFNVGAIAVAADSALGASTGPLTFNGGSLKLLGSFDLSAARAIVLNGPNNGLPGGGTIDTNSFQTTISQGITGAGGLTVMDSTSSTGRVILAGANTYSGGTTIASGTLQIGNGGTSGRIVGNVTDNGALAFNRSDAATFSGLVSGTGSLAQIGTGTTILTANNTYTGGTTISAGTLQLGNGGTSGGILGNVTDNGSLAFNRSDVATFPGLVSGTGSLAQIGTGTTILTANNTYTGGTTISAGTLQLGNGGTSGSIVGNVTDNGALAFNRSDVATFTGLVSGTGSLAQIGTGTTILTANNTYTGGTTISAGTLQLGNGGTSGGIVGNVTDNGVLAFNRSDVVTFPGVISGTGGVAQIGSGTTILNAVNPYSGPTNVASGVLAVGDASHRGAALSGGGGVSVASSATFGGYGRVAGNVASSGTVAVGNAVPGFGGGPIGLFAIGGDFQNGGVAAIGGAGFGNVLAVGGDYSTGSAQGVVKINTLLNDGGPLTNQITDRLLIAGNASGSSSVIVNAYGLGAYTGVDTPSATHGISLIQVAGNSSVGAFTLPSGYVTGGTPYQYQLYAFGPGSQNGAAAAGQSLVGNAGSQWDYRLENVYVSPAGPVTPTEPVPPESRPEVAPQVPAYIALPTALFGAGFQDIDNLHRRLGEIRDDQLTGLAPAAELFVRGYGSQLNYASNRSFTDFGFNSTQDYAAVQFGANYIVYNGANGTLRAGLAAMFGQLWFQPHALDGASSGRFNTDTLAGTLTWQSTSGWYVDAIVSGGAFDGNVTANGRSSPPMNGTSVAGSLEAGYPIALGWQQLALEPQAQLVYQHLSFNQITDADGIVARLGSQDQGIFRGGARLTRQFVTPEGAQITPYLKANLLEGIGGGGAVNIGDTPFLTGRFGTSMQVGGGATGMITRNLSVYGDVAWQDGVGGGGARGWTMNGGLRYAF